jgi:hypothetical protein
MLAAIKSEASANQAILDESFKPYFKDGLVLRELSVGTVSQYLANALFNQYATPNAIEVLNIYLRNLKLANAYRARIERSQMESEGEKFLESIIKNWDKNLKLCEANIEEIIRLDG